MDGQARMTYAQVEAGPALGEFAACHHFGHDQARAMRMGASPERLVGDTRHRREEYAIADFHAADVERRGQFGQVNHAQKPSTSIRCTFSSHISHNVQRGMTSH